mmetsp:Transcript_3140/g.7449  ORF Transcript_3140/g.7449 Transcript_3140/m.7449 type:complete len:216 (+) Transcript_3140:1902-2549(+)
MCTETRTKMSLIPTNTYQTLLTIWTPSEIVTTTVIPSMAMLLKVAATMALKSALTKWSKSNPKLGRNLPRWMEMITMHSTMTFSKTRTNPSKSPLHHPKAMLLAISTTMDRGHHKTQSIPGLTRLLTVLAVYRTTKPSAFRMNFPKILHPARMETPRNPTTMRWKQISLVEIPTKQSTRTTISMLQTFWTTIRWTTCLWTSHRRVLPSTTKIRTL